MWEIFRDCLSCLLAQVPPDPNGGIPITLTGFWLGVYAVGASLAAALGTVLKLYFDDREKRRASDIIKLRLTLGNDRMRRNHIETREYLERLVDHIAKIPGCPLPIPEPPGPPESFIPHEPDDNHG